MNEITLNFNLQSPQEIGEKIEVSVNCIYEKDLLYKMFLGCEGIWVTLKDFGKENKISWIPEKDGKYIIMVQAKEVGSIRPFDYISREEYYIGQCAEKLATKINLEKNVLRVGEKLKLSVDSNRDAVVYKYWLKEDDNWELIKDYCAENTLNISMKTPGIQEIMVEAKDLNSKNAYDDLSKVEFEVLEVKSVEINDFQCLSNELLVGKELVFQVDAYYEDARMVLYKFLKIDSTGVTTCVQDYSTKRIVSYVEDNPGDYKLLCLAKDMYSPKEYDDRAVISFCVRLYNNIVIQSFTTDLCSPQICDSSVELKAIVKGGNDLLYRFIIDGNCSEDSGYMKDNTFVWNTRHAGEYIIDLWVKDASFQGKFEVKDQLEFTIDEISTNAVKIQEVILNKEQDFVKNEAINVKVIATGGVELKYSFIITKDGQQREIVEYGNCNWVNFIPKESGLFELEVRVKDKYSFKNYDCHSVINFEIKEFIPAEIDYVLLDSKVNYFVGDTILIDIVARKTKDTKVKYALRINGHKVEEVDYSNSKRYSFTPKYHGTYVVELYAKNIFSSKEFDYMKEVTLEVKEAIPVTNTKIHCDKTVISVNESASFSVKSEGGKDVSCEFYLQEQDEWNLVQRYSKKDYYSFMPFTKGHYKILALCRSQYKNSAYEDYDMMEFMVE